MPSKLLRISVLESSLNAHGSTASRLPVIISSDPRRIVQPIPVGLRDVPPERTLRLLQTSCLTPRRSAEGGIELPVAVGQHQDAFDVVARLVEIEGLDEVVQPGSRPR